MMKMRTRDEEPTKGKDESQRQPEERLLTKQMGSFHIETHFLEPRKELFSRRQRSFKNAGFVVRQTGGQIMSPAFIYLLHDVR